MQEFRFVFIEKDIKRVVKQLLSVIKGQKHFALYGAMGVGKTTLITAICKALGTDDLVSSPTFAIINEYSSQDGEPIFHFDFYRIKDPVELLDIGFHEYCTIDAFCFIEWPNKGEHVIPDDFLKLQLEEQPNGNRVLSFRF
ncbi:hypothetical protein ES705_18900 [subsurface metagenome]